MASDVALAHREVRSRSADAFRRRRPARVVAGVLTAILVLMAGIGGAGAVADEPSGAKAHSAKAGVLKMGSRGPTVAKLQRKLRISADGVYGRKTRAAVKRYQRRRGLVADGIAGPQTLAALGIPPPRRASRRRRESLSATLERIARCESGGNPRAVSPDGRYRGKYQFDRDTWRAMGGRGDPARASEREQDRRATRLLRLRGTAPWPACA